MNEQNTPPIPYPVEQTKEWIPPIPGRPTWPMGTDFVAVYYPMGGWPLARTYAKSLCWRPFILICILWMVWLVPQQAISSNLSCFGIPVLWTLWQLRLLFRKEKALLTFDDLKVWKFAPTEFYPFTWNTKFLVVKWSGDVLFVFWRRVETIPREAFASREEAREFAAIVRELKRTNGSAWRPEWSGRIFGVHPEEGGTLSIPR